MEPLISQQCWQHRLVLSALVSDPRKAEGAQPRSGSGFESCSGEEGEPELGFLLPARRTAGSAQPPPVGKNSDVGCLMSLYHLNGLVLRPPSSVTGSAGCLTVSRLSQVLTEKRKLPGEQGKSRVARCALPSETHARSEVLSAAARPRGRACKVRREWPRPRAAQGPPRRPGPRVSSPGPRSPATRSPHKALSFQDTPQSGRLAKA